jgi:hypothetical protein
MVHACGLPDASAHTETGLNRAQRGQHTKRVAANVTRNDFIVRSTDEAQGALGAGGDAFGFAVTGVADLGFLGGWM